MKSRNGTCMQMQRTSNVCYTNEKESPGLLESEAGACLLYEMPVKAGLSDVVVLSDQKVDAQHEPYDCRNQVSPFVSAKECYDACNAGYKVKRCQDFIIFKHISYLLHISTESIGQG